MMLRPSISPLFPYTTLFRSYHRRSPPQGPNILHGKGTRYLPSPNNLGSRESPPGVPRPTFREPSSSHHRRHSPSSRVSIGSRRRDRLAAHKREVQVGQNSRKCRFERMHREKKPARQSKIATSE